MTSVKIFKRENQWSNLFKEKRNTYEPHQQTPAIAQQASVNQYFRKIIYLQKTLIYITISTCFYYWKMKI